MAKVFKKCNLFERFKLYFSKEYMPSNELYEKLNMCSDCSKHNDCNTNISLKKIYWKKVGELFPISKVD